MVNDVVRGKAHAVEGRGRVEVAGHARAGVDVLANAAEVSGLVGVCGADALADHVPLGAAGEVRDLFRLHDVQELGADLAGLAEALWVH